MSGRNETLLKWGVKIVYMYMYIFLFYNTYVYASLYFTINSQIRGSLILCYFNFKSKWILEMIAAYIELRYKIKYYLLHFSTCKSAK